MRNILIIFILFYCGFLKAQIKDIKVTNNNLINSYIQVLIEDSTVYIPTLSDYFYYKDSLHNSRNVGGLEPVNLEKVKVTEALYELRGLQEKKIKRLLFSPYSNIKVYAYILYIANSQNIYFDYLLESFRDTNVLVYIDYERWANSECYLSDILLLVALKIIDCPGLLPKHWQPLYGLSQNEKQLLKIEYEKRKPLDEYIDKLIRQGFDSDGS